MTRHAVYLEMAEDGRCMAHVPDLPGCVVHAPARNQALAQLPGAIRDYYAWLRRHGEPAKSGETPIEIEIAGESSGIGPFDPGSAAALFPPDRKPLSFQEIKDLFRLMAHSRADLLALVRDLPDEVLDYQPHPDSFSIRRLLRHVGNAEEWYVSRLVSPETLPPEWEHDEDLPLFEFLEMERRTAQARLCHGRTCSIPPSGPTIPKSRGRPAKPCAASWSTSESTPPRPARSWLPGDAACWPAWLPNGPD